MFFKTIRLVFFLLLFFANATAQNQELGKVSLAELESKVHPNDTTAVAAILFNKAKTVFVYDIRNGFSAVHEFQIRIKIYKKEGLSWANFTVPYYVGYENDKKDVVQFSNGMIYNLENKGVVKTKLTNEGTFKQNVNKYWNEATIVLPNVKVGSVIEFKYILKSANITKFPVFNVQYDIPVDYFEYNSKTPEFFIYKPILKGFVAVKNEMKLENGSQNYEDKFNATVNMYYKQINSMFTAENVPALIGENYVDNIKNYRSSINYELERTRFPEEPVKDYSITWEGVAKTIYKEDDFGKELNEHAYLEQDVRAILKDATTPEEKMDIIFKFVQNKMNWNNDYGFYTDKGVKKAYLDRTGNVAEINFILIAMLKLAGIKANPVLTCTVDRGIPTYPNRTIFNYVIAAVQIDDKQILLDATNKFTSPNILPLPVLNWTGRLIEQDGNSAEINLYPSLPSRKNYSLLLNIDANGKMAGKIRIQRKEYDALRFREENARMNKDNYLEKIENDWNGVDISDYSIENTATDFSKPVTETFTFSTEKHSDIINGKMYINPMLFFTTTVNPFVQEKRVMPIYFQYPKLEKFSINFEIPEGFAIESMPKGIEIVTPDSVASFSLDTLLVGNKIQIQVSMELNKAIVSADYYDALKDFFQKIIEKEKEQIVLKKR